MTTNGDVPHSDDNDDSYYETDDLTRIHTAIVDNDVAGLREACAVPSAEVNEKFTDEINASHAGMTPLALAAALDRVELVKVLIDYGGNVNATFANLETTALMTSSFHGHTDVVRTLLENGANARAIDLQGSTALGYCFGGSRTIEVVNMLIKAGVDVNQKNILGMNALLLVAGYGNDELIRSVLSAGAEPNATNDFGHSPLHLAVVGKRSQIAMIVGAHGTTPMYGLNRRNLPQTLKDWANGHADLLGGGRVDEKEFDKIGNFMMSVGEKLGPDQDLLSTDDQEAVKRKLDAVLEYRRNTMHEAKNSKKSGVVDTLLSCGGRRSKKAKAVNTGSAPSDRPAPAPIVSSDSPEEDRKIKELTDNFARIIRILLDAKCDVDISEHTFGMTALDMAILMGDVESTVLLTAGGGDSDHLMKLFALSDLYGHIAVNPDKKRVKELIDGDTYLDVNGLFCNFNVTKKTEEEVEQEQKDGYFRSDDGQTPMAVASRVHDNSTVDIIKMLKKHNGDINKVGPKGRCPLGEAARIGNVKMASFLVAQGANVEQPSPGFKNATPVTIAVICKQPKVVEYLIGEGAKIDAPMSDGRVALDKAWEASDMPMIDTLLQNAQLRPNKNFIDPNGLSYKMAEKYDQPTRDIESILKEISNNVKALEEKDKKQADAEKEKVRQENEAYLAKLEKMKKPVKQPEPAPRGASQQNQNQQQPQQNQQQPQQINQQQQHKQPRQEDAPDGNAHRKHQSQVNTSKTKAPSSANHSVPPQVQSKQKQAPQQRPPSSEESSAEEEEESESEMDIPEPPADNNVPVKKTAIPVQQPVVPARPRKDDSKDARVERTITTTTIITPAERKPQGDAVRSAPLLSSLPPPPPVSSAPLANKDNDDESFSEEEDEEEEEETEEESEEEEEPKLQLAVNTTKPNVVPGQQQVTSSTTRVIKNANGTSNTVTSTKTVTRTVIATSSVVPSVHQAQLVQSNQAEESESEEEEEESEEGSEEEEEDDNDIQDVNSNMAKIRVGGQRPIVLNRSAETDI